MELHQKLQNLRKQKGLTQEELADALFVSRTAVSKWESGRGYPNIDSLKAIARFFNVTIDELLCSDELLIIAEEDSKHKEGCLRDLVFGLLDISVALLLFLPLFGQKTSDIIQGVSLLSLTDIPLYINVAFYGFTIGTILLGLTTLVLQNCRQAWWMQHKSKVSLLLNAVGVLLFIISQQPYAAVLLFIFLTIKVLMLLKRS